MTNILRITSVEFDSFKAFSSFSLSLQAINILVGPNNCGKSTIISAFRVLQAGLRKARTSKPEWLSSPDEMRLGYQISSDSLPISTENVHTDYATSNTTITFRFSNSNRLQIYFPASGGCFMFPLPFGRPIRTASEFREAFPITVSVIPVLGPVEHKEVLLKKDTVQQALSTTRASRHFRNYWYHFPEGFDDFACLVKKTWLGMEIKSPEIANYDPVELYMFASENRMTRELFWCGFGF